VLKTIDNAGKSIKELSQYIIPQNIEIPYEKYFLQKMFEKMKMNSIDTVSFKCAFQFLIASAILIGVGAITLNSLRCDL
jgi:hypothetical protein